MLRRSAVALLAAALGVLSCQPGSRNTPADPGSADGGGSVDGGSPGDGGPGKADDPNAEFMFFFGGF